MKIKSHFFIAGLAIILLSGCLTSSDKLPAGDIDIYVKYQDEIATLHNRALRTDSVLKYEAALTLYKNVDFSFVRGLATLEKIFGASDAHIGKWRFDKRTIIYVYRNKEKRVRFVFIQYNSAIIHSECTDKIK